MIKSKEKQVAKYLLLAEDILNLMAIKGGAIADIVDSESLDHDEKVRRVNSLGQDLTELTSDLAQFVVAEKKTSEE